MRIRCPKCGEDHDISRMDIRFERPDALRAIPREERGDRVLDGDDACIIRDAADTARRYFLRVALPVPIRGEEDPFCWGIWVEVSAESYRRTDALWDAPEQTAEPPFPATLANEIPEFPGSLGLPGTVQLMGPTSIPWLTLAGDLEHPVARMHRKGVFLEQVLEWLAARIEH